MFIYKITNKENGMIYIGQTIGSIKRRWSDHISNAKYKATGRFYRAINKYGSDGFVIEELARAHTIEELNELEEKLIDEYNCLSPNGYNILPGGKNRRHHPETKQKLSDHFRGKTIPNRWDKGFTGTHTDTTKAKIAEKLKGRPIKNRQNGAAKGRPCTWGDKIKATMLGSPQPWKYKKVIEVETGIIYESIQSAVKSSGLSRANMMYYLKTGNKCKSLDLTFKYYKETT